VSAVQTRNASVERGWCRKHHSLWLLQHQLREAPSIQVLELQKDIPREYGHTLSSTPTSSFDLRRSRHTQRRGPQQICHCSGKADRLEYVHRWLEKAAHSCRRFNDGRTRKSRKPRTAERRVHRCTQLGSLPPGTARQTMKPSPEEASQRTGAEAITDLLQCGGILTAAESIVEHFVCNASFLELPLRPFVTVEPKPDWKGSICVALPKNPSPFQVPDVKVQWLI
jgi:hypothetical protein